MDIRFSLRQLQLFVAIARSGGVSTAAAQLGMSQSAASTALIELETRYQRPLFERVGKRLRLSEIGHQLLPVAMETLDRAAKADAVLRGRSGPGPLQIGATQTIGTHLAPRLIARYRARHATSPVTLDIANTADIAGKVEDFTLDLGLIEGEHSGAKLLVENWLADEMVAICAPSHPLAACATCSVEQVLAEKWVVRERGSGTRQALDHAMLPHASRWTIALELEQTQAIVEMVAASPLIGCVSRLALEGPLALGQVRALSVPALDLRRKFTIIRHRDKYQTEGMDAMLALCAEMAAGAG